MNDLQIVELYHSRNEDAIRETEQKYGPLCHSLAYHILNDRSDAEECVNDTYLALWNAIPPARPHHLKAFVARIARNIAFKRLEYNRAAKRASPCTISLDELDESLPDSEGYSAGEEALGSLISEFLRRENPESRQVFIRRYYFYDSISEIARMYAFSESKVKSMLYHTRNRLRHYLTEKGVTV